MSQQGPRKTWTNARKEKAKRTLEAARAFLDVRHFDVRVIFSEEEKEDSVFGLEVLAETATSDAYFDVLVTLHRSFARSLPKEQFKCAIHELIHAILAPLDRYARKAVSPADEEFYVRDTENVVVTLTRAVLRGRH